MAQYFVDRIVQRALSVPSRWHGYSSFIRRLRSRSVAIVMYHGVTAQQLPVFNWCQLAIGEFERQIEWLATEYKVLPLTEVLDRLAAGGPLEAGLACVTFDDAFRNVRTTALPVLARLGVPATVFAVTSLVGTRQPAWPDAVYEAISTSRRDALLFQGRVWPLATAGERSMAHRWVVAKLKEMEFHQKEARLGELFDCLCVNPIVEVDSPLATMDWEDIGALLNSGLFEVGSHTHTHQILSRCDKAMQVAEMRTSRDILRSRLGSADLFAYPNGTPDDFTSETRRCLVELGYRCGLSTIPGLNSPADDPYSLRRVNVGANMSLSAFEAAMAGL